MTGRRAIESDLSAREVARRMGVDETRFADMLPGLIRSRRFPAPDPDTGRFDPEAVERWRRLRNSHLFPELTAPPSAIDARAVMDERLRRMGRSKHGA